MPVSFMIASSEVFSYPKRQKTFMALSRARSGSNSLGRAISGISSLQLDEFDTNHSGLYSLESLYKRSKTGNRKILDMEGKMPSNRKLRAGVFVGFLFATTVAALSQA